MLPASNAPLACRAHAFTLAACVCLVGLAAGGCPGNAPKPEPGEGEGEGEPSEGEGEPSEGEGEPSEGEGEPGEGEGEGEGEPGEGEGEGEPPCEGAPPACVVALGTLEVGGTIDFTDGSASFTHRAFLVEIAQPLMLTGAMEFDGIADVTLSTVIAGEQALQFVLPSSFEIALTTSVRIDVIVQAGEPPATSLQLALSARAFPSCGDGFIDRPEQCDDGALVDGDGCTGCVGDFTAVCSGEPSACERTWVDSRGPLDRRPGDVRRSRAARH